MAIREKKRAYDNKGSAIITALVVSTVLMVLCLSLLAVSYSLFLSTKDDTSGMNYREMLYSSAEALESEITDKNNIDLTGDTDANGVVKLNRVLLNSVWQGFVQDGQTYTQPTNCGQWLYYDPLASDDHGDLEKCSRYFQLKSIGSVKIIAQFYWQLPWSDITQKWDGTDQQKLGTVLHAIYRLYDNKDNLLVKAEKAYSLIAEISTGSGTGSGGSTGVTNPGNYTIYFDNCIGGNGLFADNNKTNSCFLPATIYDAREDDIIVPTVIFGNCTWYLDANHTKVYDTNVSLKNNIDQYGIQGNDITLYAAWEKPPRRIRFIDKASNYQGSNDPGECILTTYILYNDHVPYNSVLGDPTRWKYHPDTNNSASGWFSLFSNSTVQSGSTYQSDLDVFCIYNEYYNGSHENINNPNKNVPGYLNGRFSGSDSGSTSVTATYYYYWERIYSQ